MNVKRIHVPTMKRHEHLKLFLERVKALAVSPRFDDELKIARKLMRKYKKTRHLHKFTYQGDTIYLSLLESGNIFQIFGDISKSSTYELALFLDEDCGVTFTEHLLQRYKERTSLKESSYLKIFEKFVLNELHLILIPLPNGIEGEIICPVESGCLFGRINLFDNDELIQVSFNTWMEKKDSHFMSPFIEHYNQSMNERAHDKISRFKNHLKNIPIYKALLKESAKLGTQTEGN
tara:strand:- start:14093 stop:14794 length:702 start_codon:yes stop_codon:yes gene_type:complete